MSNPVTCSACGSGNDDLAVCQAGGDRAFIGALRILVYCAACRAHPERCAEWREAVKLEHVTEELLLAWYADGRTASSPTTAAELVWGEPRHEFITEATKILEARAAREPS